MRTRLSVWLRYLVLVAVCAIYFKTFSYLPAVVIIPSAGEASTGTIVIGGLEDSEEVRTRSPYRTLVIIIGNLRGGERAWRSLYRHVLDIETNQADLALFIGNTPVKYQNSSLFQRAKFLWRFPEFVDWGVAMDNLILTTGINGSDWRETILPKIPTDSRLLGGIGSIRGSGAIIMIIRWMLSITLQQRGIFDMGYTHVVITRADHFYLCSHSFSELFEMENGPESLWVPAGEDYGGITDRHLVAPIDKVLGALNILPDVIANPANYHKMLSRRASNPERLLQRRWADQSLLAGVRRFDRMFFTCGEDGDMTRWAKLGEEVPEGVRLKYPNEYDAAYRTCGLQKVRQYGHNPIPLAIKPASFYYNSQEEQTRLRTLLYQSVGLSNCTVRFKDPSLSLCHFVPYGNNFGDEIGPAVSIQLLRSFFGCFDVEIPVVNLATRLRNYRRADERCLFTLGSVFHFVRDEDHVYGTGVNPKRNADRRYADSLIVHSVRGPLSMNWLKHRIDFELSDNVGYGDPGFLVPYLFPNLRPRSHVDLTASPKHCFIPHFHDIDTEMVARFRNSSKVQVISPHASWGFVVDQIRACNYVASSSLHGIIIADSMGLPTLWVQFPDTRTRSTEGSFKYLDYFRSTALERPKIPFSRIEDIWNTSFYFRGFSVNATSRDKLAEETVETFPVRLFTAF